MTPRRTDDPDTTPDGTRPVPVDGRLGREGVAPRMTANIAPRTRRRAPAKKTEPIEESSLAPSPVERAVPSFAPPSFAPAPPATFVPRLVPGESMTIGEIDQTVFDCPSCSRPLALGARRCPGCSVRLVNGVVLGKASMFVAAGLALGLLVGAGSGFVLGLGSASATSSNPVASGGASVGPIVASSAPSAPPSAEPPSPSASVEATQSSIPPATRAALVQTAGSNDRLTVARTDLKAALAASSFDASDVARILRSVSADSVQAEQVATRIAAWSGSAAVGARLAGFYGTIHEVAADSLVASVRNVAAYRAAAAAMVRLLAGIPAMDEDVRAAAASLGVVIPDPTAPASAAP